MFWLLQKNGVPRMSNQRWFVLELYRKDVEPTCRKVEFVPTKMPNHFLCVVERVGVPTKVSNHFDMISIEERNCVPIGRISNQNG